MLEAKGDDHERVVLPFFTSGRADTGRQPTGISGKRSLLGLAHACTDQAVASTRLGGRNLPMSTPNGLGDHASPVGENSTTTNPPDGGMAALSLYGERGGLGSNPARPEGRGLPDRPRRTEGGGQSVHCYPEHGRSR